MFLLGISGSLLPYLLLLGVILVFSFQTTTQTIDDARNSEENTARKHVYYKFHSSKAFPGRSYYFSAENTGKQSTECCDSKVKEKQPPSRMKFMFMLSIQEYFSEKETTINPLSSFIFSGLSPPRYSLMAWALR